MRRNRAALTVSVEADSGCSVSLGASRDLQSPPDPVWMKVASAGSLRGGPTDRRPPHPSVATWREAGAPHFTSAASLKVHRKGPHLTCDPWQVFVPPGLGFPICAGLPWRPFQL